VKTLKKILALALVMLVSVAAFAQDQIIKKNKEIINCKVKEVAMDEVKYLLPDYQPDVFFTIEKSKITKIIFENGQEMDITDDLNNPENYAGQKKNALKVDFLSPLTGNTTFSYERSIKPGRSIEAGLGIIGLGIDPNDINQGGAFVKFGMKFIKSPEFYLRGMRYAHILKGGYFKPEFMIGYYSQDESGDTYEYPPSSGRKTVFSGGVQLILGKQWIMDDAFLVDFFAGMGYGFDNQDGGYHYGWATIGEGVPLSFSAGLKVGFLFK